MNTEEVARYLGRSLTTVTMAVKWGQLHPTRDERGWYRYTVDDVDAYAAARAAGLLVRRVTTSLREPTTPVRYAFDVHVLCLECGDPACKVMDRAPVCGQCGHHRYSAPRPATVYVVRGQNICADCLAAQRVERRSA